MNKKRFQILIDYLEKQVADDAFDMTIWWLDPNLSKGVKVACGCAIGHACQIKKFQDEGLSLKKLNINTPAYGDSRGIYAAAKFFDITIDQASKLFRNTQGKLNSKMEIEFISRLEMIVTLKSFIWGK